MFVLVQLVSQASLLLLLTPEYTSPIHLRLAHNHEFHTYFKYGNLALSCIAPIVSLISKRRWHQTGVWGVAPILIVFAFVMLKSVKESREGLEKLEKLKYEAKGA
jgi:hypothetical protein